MIYNPHQWFIAARQESELPLIQEFKKQKRVLCTSVGGSTEIDKSKKKLYDGEYAKYSVGADLGLEPNHYINIFGDFIIDVYLDIEVSEKINNFYMSNKSLTEEKIEELKKIVSQKGKNRLVISRNTKRAGRLRKKLSRDFFIPEPFRSNV
jgi:hypothetical protein